MENNNISQQILETEEKYWQSLKDKDVDKAIELTHFPCIVASRKGARRISESEYRELMSKMDSSEYEGVEIQNSQVNSLNENTAMITYNTNINGMDMLNISLWLKADEPWQCAFHLETPL